MANIEKKFNLLAIDSEFERWKKALAQEMEEEIKDAAKDWLKTAISIVPVWSRASQATFRPLADAVGFAIPPRPLVAPEDRSSLGRTTSSGGLDIDANVGKFFFFYETNLRYLAFNEFNHAEFPNAGIFSPKGLKTPTPFNFTGQAADQFRARKAPQLPNPLKFFTGRKI